jgi:hypothetical protein
MDDAATLNAVKKLFPDPVSHFDSSKPSCAIRPNDRIEIASSTLSRILENIINNSTNLKYRTLSLTNPAIRERLLHSPAALEYLTTLGFKQVETSIILELPTEDLQVQIELLKLNLLLLQENHASWLSRTRLVENQLKR